MSKLLPRPLIRPRPLAGFTLLELAVVLGIIAIITAGIFSMGSSMIESARRVNTNNKLDAIETALTAFRLANNRLPCPTNRVLADIPVNSATFGYETGTPGICNGGGGGGTAAYSLPIPPNNTMIPGGTTVIEGAVPVKTLGLPNEFQLDGWGRKFSYAVWIPLTATNAFVSYGANPSCGGITVKNAGGGNRSTTAAYALVSYGPDGHGGYLKNGGATRLNAGVSNAATLTNCHCTTTGANAAITANNAPATYVQEDLSLDSVSDLVNPFDDIVRFKERWQMQNAYDTYVPKGLPCAPGFRIDGPHNSGEASGTQLNTSRQLAKCAPFSRPFTIHTGSYPKVGAAGEPVERQVE